MKEQRDRSQASASPRDTSRDVHSIEEFKDAVRRLDDVEMAQFRQAVAVYAVIARCAPDDLFQTAVLRVLEGRRLWPRDVGILVFLVQAARSVASGEGNRRQRSAYRSAESVHGEDGRLIHDAANTDGSPEDHAIERQELAAAEAELASIFEDDDAAGYILIGIQDGHEGEALREQTGLNPTEFDTKRRLVRRRLNAYRAKREGRA